MRLGGIVPSGRAVAIAAATALPATAVALAIPQFWYTGLFAVLFVLALTAADALLAPRLQAATIDTPTAVFVGQQVSIGVRAGGRVSATLEHDERLLDVRAAASFDGQGALLYQALRRGTARLGALWLRAPGRLGLVWRQQRTALDRTIAILPDIRPARTEALRLFRRDVATGEIAQLDIGAGGEFHALTRYREGNDTRAIDWKASGRHGALVAKEFRTERNNDIVVAIDAGRTMCEPVDGVPRIDRAVSAALSAAFVALKLGDRVSLFGFDALPRIASNAVAGSASFATFQRLAAQLDYSTEETNFTLALTTLGGKLKRRSLVLLFTEVADATNAELMLAAAARLAQRHLVLFVLMRDAELQSLLDAAPQTPADVSRAVVAAALLRERRIVVTRLQRLGIHVVEAPYERLGAELVNAYLAVKRANRL